MITTKKTSARAATTSFLEPGGAFGVLLNFWNFVKALAEAFEKLLVECIPRRSKLIIHPRAFSAGHNEVGATQVGKVARSSGLGHVDYFYEVVDANLALAKQMQDSQAGLVRKGSEF